MVIIPAGNLLVEILLAGKLLATSLIGKVLSLDFIVGIKPRGKRTQHYWLATPNVVRWYMLRLVACMPGGVLPRQLRPPSTFPLLWRRELKYAIYATFWT